MRPIDWKQSDLKKLIEDRMVSKLKHSLSNSLYENVIEQIFPSKRIRSYFLYLLTRDFLDRDDFIEIATSVELFHQATLIADDVIDDSDIREGDRLRLHIQYGGGYRGAGAADHIAIILLLLSEEILAFGGNDRFNEVNKAFNKTKIAIFKAQLADTFIVGKPEETPYVDWLIEGTYDKTSAFFEYIFKIAEIFSKTKREYSSIGRYLGIIYQIADDLQDIEFGPNARTISLTYPLAYLLDNATLLSREEYIKITGLISKKTLNPNEQEDLNLILRSKKKLFVSGAKEIVDSLVNKITKTDSLSEHQERFLMEVISTAFSADYWEYTNI